jgi:hypothetical protein
MSWKTFGSVNSTSKCGRQHLRRSNRLSTTTVMMDNHGNSKGPRQRGHCLSQTEFSFSGIHVDLGHKGIVALAKALTCLCFFRIGSDIPLVIADFLSCSSRSCNFCNSMMVQCVPPLCFKCSMWLSGHVNFDQRLKERLLDRHSL